MAPEKLAMIGDKLRLLSAFAMFLTACTDPLPKMETGQQFPVLQLIVDVDSEWGGAREPNVSLNEVLKGIRSGNSTASTKRISASVSPALLVPISGNGLCLTAAHNVAKGEVFTPVHLIEKKAVFLVGAEGESPIISKLAYSGSFPKVERGADIQVGAVKVIQKPLTASEYEILNKELADIDAVFAIPVEVERIWKEEDLALVKVPFDTPTYFTIAEDEVSIGDDVVVFGNPLTHKGRLTRLVQRADVTGPAQTPGFYLLATTRAGFLTRGDSGGPVINSQKKLVGIHRGNTSGGGKVGLDVATGLTAAKILGSISELKSR